MRAKKKESEKNSLYKVLFIVVCAAMLLFACLLLGSYYLSRHEARATLTQAKMARLATISVSSYYYGCGLQFTDSTTTHGFTNSAYEEINQLIQNKGEVRLLQVEDNGYTPAIILYTLGNYTVVCHNGANTADWEVYKTTKLIGFN